MADVSASNTDLTWTVVGFASVVMMLLDLSQIVVIENNYSRGCVIHWLFAVAFDIMR